MTGPVEESQEHPIALRAEEEQALAEAADQLGAVEMCPLPIPWRAMCTQRSGCDRTQGSSVSRSLIRRTHMLLPSETVAALANRVHSGLSELGRKIGFRVPQWHPAPRGRDRNMYVAEEIDGAGSPLETSAGLATVVEQLVALELATRSFDPPALKPSWINSCNRNGYRVRLRSSLDGVLDRAEITDRECDDVVARFDGHWAAGPLDSGRCLAHGDFSKGNMRAAGGEIWLIDFEHAHVGARVLDMTHLYVNLVFDNEAVVARELRRNYEQLRAARGLPQLPGVFSALLLERAAGKWNAMKAPSQERRERIP